MVKRFVSEGGSKEWTFGPWVRIADYQSLQAALREALQSWETWAFANYRLPLGASSMAEKRIAALRAQFLDDKEPS